MFIEEGARDMRTAGLIAAALVVLAMPAGAKEKVRYQYGNNFYESLRECLEAKRKAKRKGAVIGAVGGAVVGAASGGSVGGTALAAGVGAQAGAVIGRRTEHC
ncbi:glycine zipper domain-containing protein [Sandaracinobacteroides saxicola]|nr:glycine zipper domain-containing protein [Sandaracinobacteroides saxicola]